MINLILPKQYYLGNLPGRFIFLYGNAANVFGMMSLVFGSSTWFMVATSYFGIQFSILIFYALLMVGIPTVMVLYWMFVTPSQIGVANEQSYRHFNPAMDKLEEIIARLERIEKHLEW